MEAPPHLTRRVSVIGMGRVGSAIADGVTRRGIATHLVLIDAVGARAASEALDLADAIPFLSPVNIAHSSTPDASAGSSLVFITAGARQRPGESRLSLLERNIAIMSSIIPPVIASSPDAIVVIVSNPCDVMTYVAARLAAAHADRVIGSGTNLDSARLVSAIARRANIAPSEVNACIIGEHGDSSVPVWSIASISGFPLRLVSSDFSAPSVRAALLQEVRSAAGEIIHAKGYTSTAVGESCADLAQGMLSGKVHVRPVTTRVPAGTFEGIDDDVYFSLPVRLGAGGCSQLFVPALDQEELKLLQKSAKILLQAQREADVHLNAVVDT